MSVKAVTDTGAEVRFKGSKVEMLKNETKALEGYQNENSLYMIKPVTNQEC